MGDEAIQYCRSYAMRAEIKMGEMLKETERAKGGQPYQKQSTPTRREEVEPTLKELGLTWKEASNAEMLASLPEEKQEAVITGKVTRADVRREIKRKDIIEKLENIEAKEIKAIQGVYDVIVIDPPKGTQGQLRGKDVSGSYLMLPPEKETEPLFMFIVDKF